MFLAINDYIYIYYIIVGVLIVGLVVALTVVSRILKKKKQRKISEDIEALFVEYVNKNPNASFERSTDPGVYDYLLKNDKVCHYIRIIENLGHAEICINSAMKWQLRRSFNDTAMRFVDSHENLLRLDLPSEVDNLIPHKTFIIYKGARTLLRYINECEMEFVYPETDVYGFSVIQYNALVEDVNALNRVHVDDMEKIKKNL